MTNEFTYQLELDEILHPVEIECQIEEVNDSFDHEFGTENIDSYFVIEKSYNKKLYTSEEIKYIDKELLEQKDNIDNNIEIEYLKQFEL